MRLIHRLIYLRYGLPTQDVLNENLHSPGGGDPILVAADLKRIMNVLRGEMFGPAGQQIDYGRLREAPIYEEFRQCASMLRTFDLNTLTLRAERMAFWINLYNALIIDAVIQFEVTRSVNDIPGFFWKAAYCIGGRRYSAFDIEYGILRANAPHPAIPGPHFGRRDPRRANALQILDPRIHFALVCAARSCPPISVYDPSKLDDQLELASRAFINNGGVELDRESRQVHLSKIFQWYAPDFGAMPLGIGDKRPILDFVLDYVNDEMDRQLLQEDGLTVKFQPYDWKLNLAPSAVG